jgi:hypothetical protein
MNPLNHHDSVSFDFSYGLVLNGVQDIAFALPVERNAWFNYRAYVNMIGL